MQRTIDARPQQAALGGDPSIASHVKAYLNVKFYQQGAWEEKLEVGFSVNCPDFGLTVIVDWWTTTVGKAFLPNSDGTHRRSLE